jgi:hypothetical protein
MLLNQSEAAAFLKSITDPRVHDLLLHAHTGVFLTMDGSEGDFDMLLFYKVLAELFSRPYIKIELIKGDENTVFGW